MKIILAYISGCTDRSDLHISIVPGGLCSIHAKLNSEGFQAVLANYSAWSEKQILEHVNNMKPDMFCISIWTHNRHASISLAYKVRTMLPNCLIAAGGAHATFQYEELLSPSDTPFNLVVIGEGEPTVSELAKCCRLGRNWRFVPGIVFLKDSGMLEVTEKRMFLDNLDDLPFATEYLECSVGMDIKQQAEFVLTSRGCPSGCTFCSSPAFWNRKLRFRSPEQIVAELKQIKERYGLMYFSFRDDTFTANRERTIAFCRLIIEERLYILWNCQSRVTVLDRELLVWMKRAGCECVQLGVESGSLRILKELGKSITPKQVEYAASLIKEVGINLSIYLISDIPSETEDDLQDTFTLIRKIKPDDGYVSPLAYFPGTSLFERDKQAGIVSANLFTDDFEEALFVAGKRGNSQRMLKTLSRHHGVKTANQYAVQKEELGFCAVTNILAGEWWRIQGKYERAEKEFKEICEIEPDNPWGALLLAELYQEMGQHKKSRHFYEKLYRLVPKYTA